RILHRDRRAGRRDAAGDRRRAAGSCARVGRAFVGRERARGVRVRRGRYDRSGARRRGGIVSAPVSSRPIVVETIRELRSALEGRTVAFVPTLGALHEGHLALVDRARELADTVVVSIFVNPL